MTFDFAISGTDIFSMMEQAQGYARRCVEFIDALKAALNADQIVAATVLGRALLETVAMGCLYVHDMQKCIESGDAKKFDERFTRYYVGVKSGSGEYKLRRYYRTASRASIWQCHFLLNALKEAEGLPEGYRKAFMTD